MKIEMVIELDSAKLTIDDRSFDISTAGGCTTNVEVKLTDLEKKLREGRSGEAEAKKQREALARTLGETTARLEKLEARSGWSLAAVAPDKGEGTGLRDIELAVMTELPTTRQGWADRLWAFRGEGVHGQRTQPQGRGTEEDEDVEGQFPIGQIDDAAGAAERMEEQLPDEQHERQHAEQRQLEGTAVTKCIPPAPGGVGKVGEDRQHCHHQAHGKEHRDRLEPTGGGTVLERPGREPQPGKSQRPEPDGTEPGVEGGVGYQTPDEEVDRVEYDHPHLQRVDEVRPSLELAHGNGLSRRQFSPV